VDYDTETNHVFSVGHSFGTFTLEPALALPKIYNRLKEQGVGFIRAKLKSLEDIPRLGDYDVVRRL
jgi:hypothetical protein